jgi:hypothetical protein
MHGEDLGIVLLAKWIVISAVGAAVAHVSPPW